MQDNKRIWVWVGIIVVVLIIVLAFVWKPSGQSPAQNQAVANPAPVYAAQGKIVDGFPQDLVLHALRIVESSYSIAYTSSTNQYTAVLNSSSSMDFIYKNYMQYFWAHGWTIANNITKDPGSRGIYAVTSTAEASIAILQEGTGSQVTASYLTK